MYWILPYRKSTNGIPVEKTTQPWSWKSNLCGYIFSNQTLQPLIFNNNYLTKCSYQNNLEIAPDSKLDWNIHIVQKIKKYDKIIKFMKNLAVLLWRKSLLIIYKSYVRPHLDYGDIRREEPKHKNFKNTRKNLV